MSEENDSTPISFDADYVKELRAEAAKYRTKAKEVEQNYKSLEGQIQELRIENELSRRGVAAEPSWIKLDGFNNVTEAVDNFLEKYPQLAQPVTEVEEEPRVERKVYPQALQRDPGNAGVPGPPAKGPFSGRDLESVKEDAKARAQLRDYYRSLLASSSHLEE